MTAVADNTAPEMNRASLEPWLKDEVYFYQHQVEGVRRMSGMRSVLLADEMGLGKSLQTLAVYCIDIKRNSGDTLLVVCPASLKQNWAEEAEKFTRIHTTVLSNRSGKPGRVKQLAEFAERLGPKILVVNYEQVEPHLEALNRMRFHMIAFDEAHMLKNPKATRTKVCMKLMSTRSFLLTGSPLLNHVNELYTLLNRITPGEFGSYYGFLQRYCNTPDAPIWMADGTFKPIGEVQIGDLVLGWVDGNGDGSSTDRRRIAVSEVLEVRRRVAPEVIKVTMESGQEIKCTPDHQWLSASRGPGHSKWVTVHSKRHPHRFNYLSRVVFPVEQLPPEKQRLADWLAGMMDGEGSGTYISQSASYNPKIHARIGEVLTELGIDYHATDKGYLLKGGRQMFTKLATWTKDVLQKDEWIQSHLHNGSGYRQHKSRLGQLNRTKERGIKSENLGPGEVVSMQTTTGNYIAWGLASKNCVYGGFENKSIVGVKNEKELNTRLAAVMVRRLKSDVLDLPEVQYIRKYVELHPRQKTLYRQVVEELKLTRANGEEEAVENSLTKFLRLKQICGTTATLPDAVDDHSLKLDAAAEDARQILDSGNRVVAFTQFRGVVDAYSKRIKGKGVSADRYPIYILNGDVPSESDGRDPADPKKKWSRQEIVKAWAENPKAGIIIATFAVAGVGLNMTAARYGQFLDKLYVPSLNQQAVDRMHRIGASASQPVQILEYLCKGTVEERVEKILDGKQKIFGRLVDSNALTAKLIQQVMEEESQ